MKNLKSLFNKIGKLKVGVIGDVMLDTYNWGHVERISPEAPIPIVSLQRKEHRIGGAGNVALNCTGLGAQVFILTVLGEDNEAKILEKIFATQKISTKYFVKSKNRVTTVKTRIICKNQQMLRLDSENSNDLLLRDENELLVRLKKFIQQEKPDILIFEDYNKGVLTEKIIALGIELCRKSGIITAVDPKRKNFFNYNGVDIFKPNFKEVKDALNFESDKIELETLKKIHNSIKKILGHQVSLITLSEKGVFWQLDKKAVILPGFLRNIADVSGAGDTVIATAALVYAASKNMEIAAAIANIAGGLVCEEVGTAAISKEKLLKECEFLLPN